MSIHENLIASDTSLGPGYNPFFLDTNIQVPELTASLVKDAALFDGCAVIDCTHFP